MKLSEHNRDKLRYSFKLHREQNNRRSGTLLFTSHIFCWIFIVNFFWKIRFISPRIDVPRLDVNILVIDDTITIFQWLFRRKTTSSRAAVLPFFLVSTSLAINNDIVEIKQKTCIYLPEEITWHNNINDGHERQTKKENRKNFYPKFYDDVFYQ